MRDLVPLRAFYLRTRSSSFPTKSAIAHTRPRAMQRHAAPRMHRPAERAILSRRIRLARNLQTSSCGCTLPYPAARAEAAASADEFTREVSGRG